MDSGKFYFRIEHICSNKYVVVGDGQIRLVMSDEPLSRYNKYTVPSFLLDCKIDRNLYENQKEFSFFEENKYNNIFYFKPEYKIDIICISFSNLNFLGIPELTDINLYFPQTSLLPYDILGSISEQDIKCESYQIPAAILNKYLYDKGYGCARFYELTRKKHKDNLIDIISETYSPRIVVPFVSIGKDYYGRKDKYLYVEISLHAFMSLFWNNKDIMEQFKKEYHNGKDKTFDFLYSIKDPVEAAVYLTKLLSKDKKNH